MSEIKKGYTRVTEISSLLEDFSKIPPDVLEKACLRGTEAHNAIETYLNFGIHFGNPYLDSFIEWFDKNVEEVIEVEKRFYSDDLMITGKVDLICKLNGDDDYSVVDFKTSEVKQRAWLLQTAAYKFMIEQEGMKIKRRICLMVSKKGTRPRVVECTEDKRDLKLFLNALELKRFFE